MLPNSQEFEGDGAMKPKVFIASSKEKLEIAYALEENLEHDVESTVRPQGIFDKSRYAFDDLVAHLDNFYPLRVTRTFRPFLG